MQARRIHILGAGSIGLLLAAHLSGQHEVVLLRRPGAARPRTLPVTLRGMNSNRHLTLQQYPVDALAAPPSLLIVCTKAYDALPALQALAARVEGCQLLLMQNGMGSQQRIAEAFPRANVYAASSTEGAYRPAPGEVVHAGRGMTRIGRLQGEHFDWAGLFAGAGLAAELAEPIEWHLANKLRINALINPLTVLHRCRNGALLEIPEALAQMNTLGEEADRVLAAAGYRFAQSSFAAAAAVAHSTATNFSSMYQDATAERRLEVDYINGYLVRLAERLGIAAPHHSGVITRLRASEAG
jgi:2-dehydropantoate 2-reductase